MDYPDVECAVVFVDCGVYCCLACFLCDAFDVSLVLVVCWFKSCECVGEFVIVDGDVTRFAVLAYVGGFAGCGSKEAP